MQLSSFKTYVKYTFKRTDKDTELVQFYNDMLNWVASQIPHSGYKFQSYVATIVGTEDYGIPATLIHLLHPIKLILGTGATDSGYPLNHISKEEFNRRWPNPNASGQTRGRPVDYTVFDRCILVGPAPDVATYYLEIDWSKRITAMSADADLPGIGAEWDEVLMQGTLERLYASIGMIDEAAYWGSRYHVITSQGDDQPVGLCRKLLEIEQDREGYAIGQVTNNDL